MRTAFTTFTTSSVTSASAATLALTSLNTFAQAVNVAMSNNASDARSLRLHSNFINSKVDAIQTGLGATVDADIGKASAEVQSRQVQRQLGVQSLSLANQQPSTLLGLFRG